MIFVSIKTKIILYLISHHLPQWFSAMFFVLSTLTSHLSRYVCQKVFKEILGWWHSHIQDFASWVAIPKRRMPSPVSLLKPKRLICTLQASLSYCYSAITQGCHKRKETLRDSTADSINFWSSFCCIVGRPKPQWVR